MFKYNVRLFQADDRKTFDFFTEQLVSCISHGSREDQNDILKGLLHGDFEWISLDQE